MKSNSFIKRNRNVFRPPWTKYKKCKLSCIVKTQRDLIQTICKYAGAVNWNKLPNDIQNANSVDSFKYQYKKSSFNW